MKYKSEHKTFQFIDKQINPEHRRKRIVFDVDGTLITAEQSPQPREEVINLLRAFNKLGWDIFVHSGGGIPYASRWVRYLKLDEEMHISIARKGDREMEYNIAVDDCIGEREWLENKSGNYIRAKHFIMV